MSQEPQSESMVSGDHHHREKWFVIGFHFLIAIAATAAACLMPLGAIQRQRGFSEVVLWAGGGLVSAALAVVMARRGVSCIRVARNRCFKTARLPRKSARTAFINGMLVMGLGIFICIQFLLELELFYAVFGPLTVITGLCSAFWGWDELRRLKTVSQLGNDDEISSA